MAVWDIRGGSSFISHAYLPLESGPFFFFFFQSSVTREWRAAQSDTRNLWRPAVINFTTHRRGAWPFDYRDIISFLWTASLKRMERQIEFHALTFNLTVLLQNLAGHHALLTINCLNVCVCSRMCVCVWLFFSLNYLRLRIMQLHLICFWHFIGPRIKVSFTTGF